MSYKSSKEWDSLETYLEYGVDIDERNIFLYDDVEDISINIIIKGILKMQAKSNSPIRIYINSFGGDMYEMFALYDIIKNSTCEIHTYSLGKCMSAAVLIAAAGTKGCRFSYRNTFFMLHDSKDSDLEGSVTSLQKEVQLFKEMNDLWHKLLSDCTGKPVSLYKKLCTVKGNEYFNSEKALEYGLIDEIL